MKRIICPVDFSDSSLNALEFAARLGEKYGATMDLIYVFTEEEFDTLLEKEHIGKEYQDKLYMAMSKLKVIAEQIEAMSIKEGLFACNYEVKSGNLVEKVLEYCDEVRGDMIVMGTSGIGQISGGRVGSKSYSILQHARCPVLCIPEGALFHGISKIVYASDYLEEDKLGIQQVITFATHLDAHIDILHVSHSDKQIDKALYHDFQNELRNFIHYQDLRFSREVMNDTAAGIYDFMHRENGDLLVLMGKRRTFLDNLLHHSVISDINKFSDFPFLVMRIE